MKNLLLLLLILLPWNAAATQYCGIEATLAEAHNETPVYTFTTSYEADPIGSYAVVHSSETYAYTCTTPTGSSCTSSEFPSSSSSTATLNPSQSGIYSVTVTLSVDCKLQMPPYITYFDETDTATSEPGIALPSTETGDDDDDDSTGDDDDDDSGETACTPSISYYVDEDGDNYGSTTSSAVLFCDTATTDETVGYVANNTDCDDADESVHPGISEDPRNYVDDDCDGTIAPYSTVAVPTSGETGDDDDDGNFNPADGGGGGCSLQSVAIPHAPVLGLMLFLVFIQLVSLRLRNQTRSNF